jgi:hypothetical protein
MAQPPSNAAEFKNVCDCISPAICAFMASQGQAPLKKKSNRKAAAATTKTIIIIIMVQWVWEM